MFSYIKGELAETGKDYIVIENSGIGFIIYTSAQTIGKAGSIGDFVKAYTLMNVKEDDISIYGFIDKNDIDIFKKLISVSGIGPKGALSIMSELSTDDLVTAIMSGDSKAISAANGIGKKTAERVILELKDKLDIDEMYISGSDTGVSNETGSTSVKDAILALTSLGYSSSDAARAVRSVDGAKDMDTEDILKAALRNII